MVISVGRFWFLIMLLLCSVVEIYYPNCFRTAYCPRCRNRSLTGPSGGRASYLLGKELALSLAPCVVSTVWSRGPVLAPTLTCLMLVPQGGLSPLSAAANGLLPHASHSSFVPVVHLPVHCHLFLTFSAWRSSMMYGC